MSIKKIYDTTTTKYKVSLFYIQKFSQTFFETLSYFPFLPPPKTQIYMRPKPKSKPKDPNIFGSGPK